MAFKYTLSFHDTDTSLLDYYMITVNTTAGFNTTMCGCMPWIRKAQLVSLIVSPLKNLSYKIAITISDNLVKECK